MAIAGRLLHDRNSFNFLRLVFALLVVVSHAFPLCGFGPEPEFMGSTLGSWAVAGFFAVSGYLITASRQRTPLVPFVARRVLRIYPAFLFCLVMVAFVFAPLSTVIGQGRMSWTSGAEYIVNNIAIKVRQEAVHDTLQNVPYPHVWDGSLWTLIYEFICYLIIGLVLFSGSLRMQRIVVITGFCFFATAWIVIDKIAGRDTGFLFNLTWLAAIFFGGAILAVWRDVIGLLPWAGVLCIGLALVASRIGMFPVLGALPVAYACVWLGASLPLWKIGRRNDISYGVYIYAFPVQQLLCLRGATRWSPAVDVLVTTAITAALAAASWFLVERPALNQKKRVDELLRRLTRRWGSPTTIAGVAAMPAATSSRVR